MGTQRSRGRPYSWWRRRAARQGLPKPLLRAPKSKPNKDVVAFDA